MRRFRVFGVRGDGRAVAAQEVCVLSPAGASAIAEGLFADCPIIEVWEESVLIARIHRTTSPSPAED